MGQFTRSVKQLIYTFLLLLLMISVGVTCYLVGKNQGAFDSSIEEGSPLSIQSSSRQLTISAVRSAGFTSFSAEDMGEFFRGKLSYYGVTDVSIDINGETVPLESALKNNQITTEEIFQRARTDATNGVCTEFATSHLGLSRFFYSYPKFEVMLTYDVFETASGERQLINELAVCSWNYHKKAEQAPLRSEITSPSSIYREDWGIEFEVVNASPTQINFNCIQTGGQHLGELQITSFSIQKPEGESISTNADFIEFTPLVIPTNSKSEHTLNWSQKYTTLPSGNYELILIIEDNYTQEKIHPLVKNFTDKQEYIIAFNIP